MKKQEGIPNGALWGFVIVLAYIAIFIVLGVFLILGTDFSSFRWQDFFIVGFKGLVYIIGGVILFIPVIWVFFLFVINDRDLLYTLRRHWPLFLLGIYMFFPGSIIPGPIDEAIASVIAIYFEVMVRKWARKQLEKEIEPKKVKGLKEDL